MNPVVPRRSAFVAGLAALALYAGLAATLAEAQTLDRAAVARWLDAYGKAWEERSPEQAAALFTQDARYHETPYDEPKLGRAGIREYWATVTADQRDVEFTAEVIAVAGNTGVAHWNAKLRSAASGAPVELDGVFVLEFAGGLCSELREWWHLRP